MSKLQYAQTCGCFVIDWRNSIIAPNGTHHLVGDVPMYPDRFDDVQKFHDPGLAPVRIGQKSWHVKPDGKRAYKREFQRVFGFYEGRAAVENSDGWFHIYNDGSDLYADRYDWCGNFREGLCPVRNRKGLYFHIDKAGISVYSDRWKYAGDHRDGFAVIQAENGMSTHISRVGQLIHNKWFHDLDVFHKNYARARDSNGWTHINREGNPVYKRRSASVEPFYNGQARVERFDGGLEVIDEVGDTIIELRSG